MAKKKATKKEENSLNLETILFNCRDYLRGSASLNDKRDVILTLVFLRFIGEKFDDAQAEMRQQCINRGITDEEKIARFLDSPSRYKNIVYRVSSSTFPKNVVSNALVIVNITL